MIGLASCHTYTPLLVFFFKAPKTGLWREMALSVVEARPACSKLLVVVDIRFSMGERCGFGISAPWSTRASPLRFAGA